VIEAEDNDTALLLWEGQASKINLLVADVNLPDGKSGRELAPSFQQTKPGLKVILTCSTFSKKDKHLPATLERLGFMPKPYTTIRCSRQCRLACATFTE